ncbi:MAG TPA: orotidine-5'-phosphate decarboxylase [Nitrospirae bacterium]|nr:orotidine-5'-phosphate decarboxylase [Nitrospirota bacterium]
MEEKLIVALDAPTIDQAKRMIDKIGGRVKWLKIGSQLFTGAGPEAVEMVKKAGCKVFLDLKYHDIPATVSGAVKTAVEMGVDMMNIHALAGRKTLETAIRSVNELCAGSDVAKPLMIAVTILTSMDAEDLAEIGIEREPGEMVTRLAAMAKKAGMDGVVASPEETGLIKNTLGERFVVVTPGIRPEWAGKDDQKRTKTPAEAIRSGSDYIVIGRPILKSDDPADAVRRTFEEMSSAV